MFDLEANGTTVRTELIAGLTTYLTMVYIAFVNPTILAAAGMDKGAVFVATCLAAAFGSALMGLWANYPVALAPGMGLNAYFAYSVVKGLGVPWQTALGAVFLSGVLFFLVSVTPLREWVINSISKSMKLAISVGIGFFLAFIGLQAAGIIAADPATLVRLGDLKTPQVGIAVAAFLLMFDGAARDVQAALNAATADLPSDLPQVPTFRKLNPSAAPVLILAMTSKILPPTALYDVADTVIAQRMSQVDGVAQVQVSGAEQPAVRVRVNPTLLAARHHHRRRLAAEPDADPLHDPGHLPRHGAAAGAHCRLKGSRCARSIARAPAEPRHSQ